MGYAPDWNKGSMKKSGATPVKHGIVSRELFHGAKTVQKFEDGGPVYADPAAAAGPAVEYNIRGQKVGQYEGNDEIAKYRMNMTDGVGGKSLRYKDNPDAKPMPEKRPYDSIDAILDDKSSYGKKAKDKDLVGDVIKAVKEANKPKAVSAPKASAPKAKPSIPEFSDDARSPDQVAPPSEFREEAGDTSRNDVRDDFPEEAGAGVPSSKRVKATYKGTNRARANRSDLSLNLSAQNPELAKKLNMYYGKK
jgi:hypothetical protein